MLKAWSLVKEKLKWEDTKTNYVSLPNRKLAWKGYSLGWQEAETGPAAWEKVNKLITPLLTKISGKEKREDVHFSKKFGNNPTLLSMRTSNM